MRLRIRHNPLARSKPWLIADHDGTRLASAPTFRLAVKDAANRARLIMIDAMFEEVAEQRDEYSGLPASMITGKTPEAKCNTLRSAAKKRNLPISIHYERYETGTDGPDDLILVMYRCGIRAKS